MPLVHGSSQADISENIRRLSHEIGKSPHVQSRAQAIAIAESQARRGRSVGGVANFALGGNPAGLANNPVLATLAQHIGSNNPASPSSAVATSNTANATGVMPPSPPMAPAPANAPPVPQLNSPAAAAIPPNPATQFRAATPGVANRATGGFNMMGGPMLTPSWQERQESRQLHVGPVLSNVPGRTDNHQVKVPGGSYVLPAQHIASMGQGNTNAGMSIASKMFGGPYGTGAMRIGHGSLPRAPKPMTSFMEGGVANHPGDDAVPVNISGGEFVIPPQEIIRRWGSLKKGHAALDKWVMDTRKKEIETQKKLPPPATK
jgi:hypothetical protein